MDISSSFLCGSRSFGSELLSDVTPSPSVIEKNKDSDLEELEKYIDEARYEDFLRSEKFVKKSPDRLFQIVIKLPDILCH